MQPYDHKRIEQKWQRIWSQQKLYQAKESRGTRQPPVVVPGDNPPKQPPLVKGIKGKTTPALADSGTPFGRGDAAAKQKFYALIEFPYPSGDGLHVGHPRPYIGMDIIARKRRMEGYNVLYPIGWDAFGLPTENYALKTGIHPVTVTKRNTKNFKRQIQSLAISFDWSREINTTDPKYYRWTQWLFLQFFKHGLAYKKKMPINWCLSCKIGLANEEVVDNKCERCGGETEKREKEQWMLAITKYADRLDKDLDTVDFAERIKTQQRNWIGRSEGINISYEIAGLNESISVFTTRPDTNFGATFVVAAPDSEFVVRNLKRFPEMEKVMAYCAEAAQRSDLERIAEGRKKTGVFTGLYALNQLNQKKLPIYVADFVLGNVGTGVVVGVPGHDKRDFEFAQAMSIEIVRVVVGGDKDDSPITRIEQVQEEEGTMVNSGFLDGLKIHEATKRIMNYLEERGWGKRVVNYKLRDWVFSRQRYWGEPIPLIFCENCRKLAENPKSEIRNPKQNHKSKIINHKSFSKGELLNPGWIAVSDDKLPVKLPNVLNYKPTESGESPLAAIASWVNVKCPKCEGPAKRETDTMPNWAGSSWYYLRYIDPKNTRQFVGKKRLAYWSGLSDLKAKSYQLSAGPVDWYNGGMEHTTLHLLYSRFWHKFLYDQKLVPTPEPYTRRTSHGLILAEGGEKMSKSKGNVINPDEIVRRFGADSLRVYEMFMGPFEQAINWSTDSLVGARRFLERVWRLQEEVQSTEHRVHTKHKAQNTKTQTLLHQTIKKVSEDIEGMRFNTAVSALMILVNAFEKETAVAPGDYEMLLKLLAPFAPHTAEELWNRLGHKKSIHREPWPPYDAAAVSSTSVTIVVQVNGKVRGSFKTARGESREALEKTARALPEVGKWTTGKEIKKVVVVPDRLVNIVVPHPN